MRQAPPRIAEAEARARSERLRLRAALRLPKPLGGTRRAPLSAIRDCAGRLSLRHAADSSSSEDHGNVYIKTRLIDRGSDHNPPKQRGSGARFSCRQSAGGWLAGSRLSQVEAALRRRRGTPGETSTVCPHRRVWRSCKCLRAQQRWRREKADRRQSARRLAQLRSPGPGSGGCGKPSPFGRGRQASGWSACGLTRVALESRLISFS